MDKCVKCGAEIQEQQGPGRPRKYCGEVCQKAAAMEIRRLDARIAKLEKDESTYRIKNAAGWAQNAAQEINRLEGRLSELLAKDADGSADVCDGSRTHTRGGGVA